MSITLLSSEEEHILNIALYPQTVLSLDKSSGEPVNRGQSKQSKFLFHGEITPVKSLTFTQEDPKKRDILDDNCSHNGTQSSLRDLHYTLGLDEKYVVSRRLHSDIEICLRV